MSDDRETIRTVAWLDVFPALHILAAVRIAMSFRLLVLAALALVGTAAGWRVLGDLFEQPENPGLALEIAMNDAWPWETNVAPLPVGAYFSFSSWHHDSPLVRAWQMISKPFEQVYRSDVTLAQWTYWLCCALWSLALWAFFGGAITRIAAVRFARHEHLSWRKVGGFVRPHWGSYVFAPLMPILATFMGAGVLALAGLLLRSEIGLLVAGILWPAVLVGGFIMAFLLIGLFFSWPLMWAAISTEGTDAFGALSHAYSYVYQRPLRYFLYGLLAIAAGVLGWFVVATFAEWIVRLANWGTSWGSGAGRMNEVMARNDLGRVGDAGVQLLVFWNRGVTVLAFSYIFSYFWVATTVIYFLLRRLVDATELDEVFLTEEQALHGLPPLTTGADGVAEPADDAASAPPHTPEP